MNTCLICKELVEDRYEVVVSDKNIDTSIKGFVCRFCYHKFIDSFHDKGFFKVAKIINWLKGKPSMRVL